ncbi:hypothetical protein KXR87_11365 [Yokenella regensburgei]
MMLPGRNPEANMPGDDVARCNDKGATDFSFDAPGTSIAIRCDFALAVQ